MIGTCSKCGRKRQSLSNGKCPKCAKSAKPRA